MQGHIIVLDIGTTTAKATVFSTKGQTICFKSKPYTFLKKEPGRFEQDPTEVYQAVLSCAKDVVIEAKREESVFNPLAISIVCQGGSLVPCDCDGNETYPMVTWMDGRGKTVSDAVKNTPMGEVILEKTGREIQPDLPLAMILWFRENNPDVYNKTSKWPNLNDYVIHKLSGNFITDVSSAALTQLMDTKKVMWDEELLDFAGIAKENLSEIKECGDLCGYLKKEAADVIGVDKGIPVINGMHDRTAEAVGLGSFHIGDTWIGTGTAWVACSIIESNNRIIKNANFHVISDKKIATKLVGGIGSSVEWWVEKLIKKYSLKSRGEAFEKMTKLAMESVPGSNGLIFKAFTGIGNEGSFWGETDSHTDADRCRAVYESIAFDFKAEYDRFKKSIDKERKLTLVGGAARSSYWPTIISEILGVDMDVSNYEHDATLGGAIMAGKYIGLADTVDGVFDIFKVDRHHITPDPANVKQYEKIIKERE